MLSLHAWSNNKEEIADFALWMCPSDCSELKVSVHPGLERVAGAHYKVVVGFEKGAGSLDSEKKMSLPFEDISSSVGS